MASRKKKYSRSTRNIRRRRRKQKILPEIRSFKCCVSQVSEEQFVSHDLKMTDLRSKNGSKKRQLQIKVNQGIDILPPIERPPKKPKITRVPLKTLNCCPNFLEQIQLIYKFIQRKEGFTYLGSNGSSLQGSLTWGSFAKIFAVLKMMLQGIENDCDENTTQKNIINGHNTNDAKNGHNKIEDINGQNCVKYDGVNGYIININCNQNQQNNSQNQFYFNDAVKQSAEHNNTCIQSQPHICNGNCTNECFNVIYPTNNFSNTVLNENQDLYLIQGQVQNLGGCISLGQGNRELYIDQGQGQNQGICFNQGQGQGQGQVQHPLNQGQGYVPNPLNQGYHQIGYGSSTQGQGQGQHCSPSQGRTQGQDFQLTYQCGQQKPIFIDLGCGSGLALFYAHISNMFSKCIGVDLMDLKSTFQLGKQLMSKLVHNNQSLLQNWEGIQACFNMDILNLNSFDDILGKEKNNLQQDIPLVVFISDTAFTDEVRWHVYEMVKKDKRVKTIITFKGRSNLSIFSARAIREALSDHFLQGMVKINENEIDELTVQLHGSLEGLKAYIYIRKALLIEKGIINENESIGNCVTFAGLTK